MWAAACLTICQKKKIYIHNFVQVDNPVKNNETIHGIQHV